MDGLALGVEATPALFRQETVAARKMVDQIQKFGPLPETLAADKAYGSGEFLARLLERGVQPHIPVIDRRHQTGGRFTGDGGRVKVTSIDVNLLHGPLCPLNCCDDEAFRSRAFPAIRVMIMAKQ